MSKENLITQDDFDLLLKWLAPNHETAGQMYEKIRQRLIRVFVGRGCFEAEQLTDETINRVIAKLPKVIENYVGEPILYFYGVADKIYLEWLKKQKKINELQLSGTYNSNDDSEPEIEYECLEACLKTLPDNQRELIIDYYRKEKTAKIKHRKEIAGKLGISNNALQVKTSRIRNGLKECIQNCIAEKNR